MVHKLFDGWHGVLQAALAAALVYVGLVVLLRVSGKRTLSQLNAFDFVVTVALGSTVASTILSSSVSVVEGLAALAVLVGLQWGVATATTRLPPLRKVVTNEPALIVCDGRILEGALDRERISPSELEQALREHGLEHAEQAEVVVLETNGNLSVRAKH